MTSDPYSERVRALFAAPDHAGDLEKPDLRVQINEQDVRVALAADIDRDIIVRLRFRAWGCPHLLAAAEAFCRAFEGRPVSALQAFGAGEIMQTLPVPREKLGRILVLEDAARSLGQSARKGPDAGKDTD
ncbi:MAG TPA: iron-sulfur cluster assembly scaffold protein [Woeseiaceae bacterium]|nr:iron-sulfur cluster assembly scaffold protein [Woeseiaceae bacterium]